MTKVLVGIIVAVLSLLALLAVGLRYLNKYQIWE